MSNTFCKIEAIARLGRKPEARYTPDGKLVVSFSAAVNRKWSKANGEEVKETIWLNVVCWGRLGEIVNQYADKGQLIYIEGRLTADQSTGGPRIWTGNDGSPRASFEVTAGTVRFLSSRGEDPAPVTQDAGDMLPPEDDIPF